MIISVINIYNGKYYSQMYKNDYLKQMIFYILGFLIIIVLKKISLNNIFKYSKCFYYFNILLLILVLIIGKPINGTRAWFKIFGFSLQPSELMKIAHILMLINICDKKDKEWKMLLKLLIYTIIPSILVFLEPDTGAIIFFFISFITICILKNIKVYWYIVMFIICSIIISVFLFLYYTDKEILIDIIGTSFFYRMDRIILFKNSNYQLDQALTSIYSSSFFRNGFSHPLLYIPEMTTDFIFSFIIGNFGLSLTIIIFVCYSYIIFYILSLIKKNKKTNYLIISFITMFFIQIIINILMNIGLIPTIGITLPFLSYGGSSLLTYFIFIGIIISLTNYYCRDK